MRNRRTLGFCVKLVSAFLAGSVGLALQWACFASEDASLLLRTVPLAVTGYPDAEGLDQNVLTAESTLQFINSTTPLIVHMEALRQAYHTFGNNDQEREHLLKSLKERYMNDSQNPHKYFDYGYAQLVMEFNKNGLFFLRKANDALAIPDTSLAYGLAQIDIDRHIEQAAPDLLTTRKMDVGYRLKDALVFNKEDRRPGIWPSYINILEGLKDYSAFDSLRNEDVTVIYVPPGNISLNRKPKEESNNALLAMETSADENSNPSSVLPEEEVSSDSASASEIETSCQFSTNSPNWTALALSKGLDLNSDGKPESINFFVTTDGAPYQVRVLDSSNQVIGEFTSYKAPYIMEDLENDGEYELVVRQFDKEPYHPLYVYRWNGQCYGEDKRITAFFQ